MEHDILVVDDEESIRKMFSSMLKKANYRVSTAESGLEALKLLKTHTYRLILLDLKMPGMDGTETLREIRKINKNVPVYIVTAFKDDYLEALKNIREDGIEFQLMKKPIEHAHFLMVVDGVIMKETTRR
jgi:two-component system response regulator (stage 0 sporulation protein F)